MREGDGAAARLPAGASVAGEPGTHRAKGSAD